MRRDQKDFFCLIPRSLHVVLSSLWRKVLRGKSFLGVKINHNIEVVQTDQEIFFIQLWMEENK